MQMRHNDHKTHVNQKQNRSTLIMISHDSFFSLFEKKPTDANAHV